MMRNIAQENTVLSGIILLSELVKFATFYSEDEKVTNKEVCWDFCWFIQQVGNRVGVIAVLFFVLLCMVNLFEQYIVVCFHLTCSISILFQVNKWIC